MQVEFYPRTRPNGSGAANPEIEAISPCPVCDLAENFGAILDTITDGVVVIDAGGIIQLLNPAAERIFGYRRVELLGRDVKWLMPSPERERHPEYLENYRRTGVPKIIGVGRQVSGQHRDGSIFPMSLSIGELRLDGQRLFVGIVRDLTRQKEVEDALKLRDRAIEAANVGIAIADLRQPDFPMIYVNSALSRITGYSREDFLGRDLRVLDGSETDLAARDAVRRAMQEGIAGQWVFRHHRKDGTEFWSELRLSPVMDEAGALTHCIGVVADVGERQRAEEERRELEFARRIQLSLLPKAPLRLPSIEAAGVCMPAAHIAGDYFDFFPCGSHVDLVIADVSGHSVGAGLMMTEMRSTLKAEIRRSRTRPSGTAGLLSTLNDLLYADLSEAELFVTMFYLRYEPNRRQLRYANAGHNHALLLRRDAESCIALDAEGMILGALRETEFEEKRLFLEPEDQLLLYTDGLVEAEDTVGEFYGLSRLCGNFRTFRHNPPEALLRLLLEDLNAFRGTTELRDDVTLVAVRIS